MRFSISSGSSRPLRTPWWVDRVDPVLVVGRGEVLDGVHLLHAVAERVDAEEPGPERQREERVGVLLPLRLPDRLGLRGVDRADPVPAAEIVDAVHGTPPGVGSGGGMADAGAGSRRPPARRRARRAARWRRRTGGRRASSRPAARRPARCGYRAGRVAGDVERAVLAEHLQCPGEEFRRAARPRLGRTRGAHRQRRQHEHVDIDQRGVVGRRAASARGSAPSRSAGRGWSPARTSRRAGRASRSPGTRLPSACHRCP